MDLPKKIKDELYDYCRLNDILNIEEFILKMVKQGFTVEKFGSTPNTKEKIVEVEKVVEKIVEVKVEVPIEKVIEKEVYITDNAETSVLTKKINKLEKKISDNDLVYKKTYDTFEEKIKSLNKELNDRDNIIEVLKKEVEKNKNKKDFYGE